MKKTHEAITGDDSGSAYARYLKVVVGRLSLRAFLYHEFCLIFTFVPGALGMALRKLFWPKLFASCGKGTVFGCGVIIRHPGRIVLGESVVISEYCILDARHETSSAVIEIGSNTILSNNVMLSCKNGTISIGNHVGINAQSIIQSTTHNHVQIGDDCVIGQRCFIIGGGNYDIANRDEPIRAQPIKPDGGVRLARNVWLGGNVSVVGGVTMGEGSIAAAGSVVTKPVTAYSICMGVPAQIVRTRS